MCLNASEAKDNDMDMAPRLISKELPTGGLLLQSSTPTNLLVDLGSRGRTNRRVRAHRAHSTNRRWRGCCKKRQLAFAGVRVVKPTLTNGVGGLRCSS